jgi:uncharacterized repeat protein (TIGR03803 family)
MHIYSVRNLVGACLSAALLASCGGGDNFVTSSAHTLVMPQIGLTPSTAGASSRPFERPPREQPLKSGAEQVLYSFKGLSGKDGANPEAALTVLNGTIYGTTSVGGLDTKQCGEYTGCGTVFELSTSGAEQVLHSFKGAPDGINPYAGLVAVNGELYGTTYEGGNTPSGTSDGTVFEVNPSTGKEAVVYSFKGSNAGDGAYAFADLISVNGVLYGTTQEGGVCDPYCGYGTVFELSPSGSESVLHSFSGGGFYNAPDGGYPQAGLVDLNGTMYGTTADGGGTACVEGNGSSGCGTVFDVGASGSESVLYRFKGKTGAYPTGDLVSAKGALFGTTDGGGDSGSGSGGCSGNHAFGCGVVFELSTKGKEHVLHFFKGGSDGWGPLAGIVAVNGTLYGTTSSGGGSGCNGYGCGTVFEISTTGKKYRVLYRFSGGTDGSRPFASLILMNGALYGTTNYGGSSTNCPQGCGTVFKITL